MVEQVYTTICTSCNVQNAINLVGDKCLDCRLEVKIFLFNQNNI